MCAVRLVETWPNPFLTYRSMISAHVLTLEGTCSRSYIGGNDLLLIRRKGGWAWVVGSSEEGKSDWTGCARRSNGREEKRSINVFGFGTLRSKSRAPYPTDSLRYHALQVIVRVVSPSGSAKTPSPLSSGGCREQKGAVSELKGTSLCRLIPSLIMGEEQ